MKELNQSDKFHLRAAEGWLGLGDTVSASSELENISPKFRAHPAVLLMRCQIYQDEERLDAVIEVADTLVKKHPDIEAGWILRSYALHEYRRTREAYDLLVPGADRFPNRTAFHYNLACYACQLGQLQEAMQRLQRAIEVSGKKKEIILDAVNEPDL
ncbi:MAG: tetratricopeptide repeat protein, partial [Verrucomicrobiota bacterium]